VVTARAAANSVEQQGTLEQQGWWSEAQQLPAPVPLKPATGTNLVVGNDVNGPNAIAAVRYRVDGAVAATLTLTIIARGTAGTPVLSACPAAGAWQPATGGAWTDRPTFSCLLSAPGVVSGSTVAFALSPALQSAGGIYDLALVPRPGDTTPFVAQFAAATDGSLRASAAPEAAPSTDEPLVALPDLAADELPAFVPLDFGVLPDVTTTAPATSAGPAASRPRPLVAANPIPAVPTKRGPRAIALATLLLMLGVAWWFGGGPVRSPRFLGPRGYEGQPDADRSSPARTGGIGRFARPRDRLPPRL
jgi:hypothetical protein